MMAQTGWYLHGVGSALASLQLYGIERQRQAFAISAHIFDLLLSTEDLEFHERLQYVFAAQIAFLRSDADPNAIAVRRRQIPPPSGLELITSSSTTALELGTALLRSTSNPYTGSSRVLRRSGAGSSASSRSPLQTPSTLHRVG